MEMFIGISLVIIFFSLIKWSCFWLVHRRMTIDSSRNGYRYGRYSDFVREFRKFEWVENDFFNKSYYAINDRSGTKIHASILKFDDKGLVLYPLSYLIFCYKHLFNKLPKLKHQERLIENRDESIDKIIG